MADEESEEKAKATAINLKVVSQDNHEIFFKCKVGTALSKLMNAYCDRQGLNINTVRFLFDGVRIGPEKSPADLDMEDGDTIDVMVEQVGGC